MITAIVALLSILLGCTMVGVIQLAVVISYLGELKEKP